MEIINNSIPINGAICSCPRCKVVITIKKTEFKYCVTEGTIGAKKTCSDCSLEMFILKPKGL